MLGESRKGVGNGRAEAVVLQQERAHVPARHSPHLGAGPDLRRITPN